MLQGNQVVPNLLSVYNKDTLPYSVIGYTILNQNCIFYRLLFTAYTKRMQKYCLDILINIGKNRSAALNQLCQKQVLCHFVAPLQTLSAYIKRA